MHEAKLLSLLIYVLYVCCFYDISFWLLFRPVSGNLPTIQRDLFLSVSGALQNLRSLVKLVFVV